MVMMLSSWQANMRVHPVYLVSETQCQVVANRQTKRTDLGCESADGPLPSTSPLLFIIIA